METHSFLSVIIAIGVVGGLMFAAFVLWFWVSWAWHMIWKQGKTTCEFCGYEFPDECGRYSCPNCLGEKL